MKVTVGKEALEEFIMYAQQLQDSVTSEFAGSRQEEIDNQDRFDEFVRNLDES